MKVLLIVPPNHQMVQIVPKNMYRNNWWTYPPLSIMYLSSYLKKNTEHQIILYDASLSGILYKDILKKLLESKPDVVGMTADTPNFYDIVKIAKITKEHLPQTKIVLGGTHTAIYPTETVEHPNIDFAILGDGEYPLEKLLSNLETGHPQLTKIDGLVYSVDKKICHNPVKAQCDLNNYPFPDRISIHHSNYGSLLDEGKSSTTMVTSRGCPFNCTYCGNQFKQYRQRSASNVVDEMEAIINLGIERIHFFDETFNLFRDHVVNICNEIIRRHIRIEWSARCRPDVMDTDLASLLKKANCIRVHYGIESVNHKSLKWANRNTDIEIIKKAVEIVRKAGLETSGYFILGFPGETNADIFNTVKLSCKLKIDSALFRQLEPMPGTKFYSDLLKDNIVDDYWLKYVKNPWPDMIPPDWNNNFTREQLMKNSQIAFRKFYYRPSIIIKNASSILKPKLFYWKAKTALKMASSSLN